MDAFTPQQTMELLSRVGQKKSKMRLDKLWWNSFLAGPLLGFGLVHFKRHAYLHKRCGLKDIAISWVMSFFGNLAGMLFFMAIIVGYGGVFSAGAYKEEAIKFAVAKAVTPHWHQIFLKAIGANWLVCLAVFMAASSREISSKILAIWWPIMCFVGLGLDHVIANMFLVPIGIFNGAPFGVGYYIWKSMIPALLGNTIGGGLFVGVVYWYLYMTGDEAVSPDFDKPNSLHGTESTADEMAGPNGDHKGYAEKAA
ncbi:hypothetical protein B0A48_11311 [Cryoendolithus antarcticus]|uniref:Formate/nitrite transporter n=1 Tax=Cryoendolithus antarcticus TaxID=1507870 RepID=A0A1V8SV12_9PEZI|nr:hypothetical protein B0A48_11311 [Cryoendolithus antarcticus]